MKKLLLILACTMLVPALAHAQASGNFSATGTSAACAICNANASTPNPACANTLGNGNLVGGTALSSFSAKISTSNGNGVTLDIRPDLVTGLFTDTKISTTVPSATAEVGIQVCVTVDGSGDGVLPAPCVIYDERFQQLSSQLFSQLTQCTASVTGSCTTATACSATSPCTGAGQICLPSGVCADPSLCTTGSTCNVTGTSAGECIGPNPLCNIELILSTLSAHSFDFIVSMPGQGQHTVAATWSMVDANATTGANEAACVGPGVLTVTQYKVFKNSGALTFGSL